VATTCSYLWSYKMKYECDLLTSWVMKCASVDSVEMCEVVPDWVADTDECRLCCKDHAGP
jgi:hypothetical protein